MTKRDKKADHQWVIECLAYLADKPPYRTGLRDWRVLRRWEEPNSLERCIRWATRDTVVMNNTEDYRIHNLVTNEAMPMAIFT